MGIISINNGYWATKVVDGARKYTFESCIEKQIDDYSEGVVIGGVKYKVGEGSRDIGLDKSKNTVQLACIAYALGKCGDIESKVITSLPVNLYVNRNVREEYLEKILSLKTNSKIVDARVYMEGAAAQLYDAAWYQNRLVVLIDIGGLTINVMIFDNGKLVAGTQDSFNLGTIILDNKIRTALSRAGCDNYTDYQIPYLFSSSDPIIEGIVCDVVSEHIEEIRQTLKKKGYPTKIEYRFTGGGSLRIKDYLKREFNGYIGNNPVWENAIGQYLVGAVIWK